MTSTREKIVTKAKIGSIEFEAQAASGGGKRRLVRHEAIGVDGASIEDTGEAPRVEQLAAHLDEAVYQQIENLRREAKVQTCTHPLFGVFQGRIEEITYDATQKYGVNVKITLVEDGEHTIQLAPQTLSLSASAGAFDAGLDDWLSMPASTADLGSAQSAFDDFDGSLGDFSDALDLVQSGAAPWQSLGSALDDLGSSLDSMVDSVFDAADDLGQMGMDIVDSAYSMVRTARECVDAAQSELGSVLQPFRILEPMSVAGLCREWLGTDDDDALDAFLEANPHIIDENAVATGIELVFPMEM